MECNCGYLLNRYAQRHGYPILEYVALPRIGALKTLLDTLTNQNEDNSASGNVSESGCVRFIPAYMHYCKHSVVRWLQEIAGIHN